MLTSCFFGWFSFTFQIRNDIFPRTDNWFDIRDLPSAKKHRCPFQNFIYFIISTLFRSSGFIYGRTTIVSVTFRFLFTSLPDQLQSPLLAFFHSFLQ